MHAKDKTITVALTGQKFAGKGTFAGIAAKEHGFSVYRTRDQILADAAEYGIVKPRAEISIAEMQMIGNAGRAKGGNGYWAERLFDAARTRGARRFLMDGVRHPDEITALAGKAKASGGIFFVIAVEASAYVRFGRTSGRDDEGDAAMRDIKAFLDMDDADRGIGQPWSGQQVDACMAYARELAARQPYIATVEDMANDCPWPRNNAFVLRNEGSLEHYQGDIRHRLYLMENAAYLPMKDS
jgi:dephospho-CoA kinase